MTQEEKELLLIDLCAKLPHKVIVEIISYTDGTSRPWFGELSCKDLDCFIHDVAYKSIKPYLRPMSSMTEEEAKECDKFSTPIQVGMETHNLFDSIGYVDWLNKHHFDYRRLIPKGLAIEVTKENTPYK